MTERTTDAIIAVPDGFSAPALSSRDLTRGVAGQRMDPFLIASQFDMRGPVFPPHPHAGFAVMTYILPESETGFRNQDSTGFANIIAPGELHVTLAGRGVQHEETNVENGRAALGFQIWIDLPEAHRQDAPRPIHVTNDMVPTSNVDGIDIRVLAGGSNGMEAAVDLPVAFRLVDVTLAPGARFVQELTGTENAHLRVLSGEVGGGGVEADGIGADGAGVGSDRAHAGEALFTAPGGTTLTATAGADGARFVLFAGEPLGQRPVMGGPFVASSAEELQGFKRAFAEGRMGALTAFGEQPAA